MKWQLEKIEEIEHWVDAVIPSHSLHFRSFNFDSIIVALLLVSLHICLNFILVWCQKLHLVSYGLAIDAHRYKDQSCCGCCDDQSSTHAEAHTLSHVHPGVEDDGVHVAYVFPDAIG